MREIVKDASVGRSESPTSAAPTQATTPAQAPATDPSQSLDGNLSLHAPNMATTEIFPEAVNKMLATLPDPKNTESGVLDRWRRIEFGQTTVELKVVASDLAA